MSVAPLRVVVVDDEPHARADIVELLASHSSCELVATCSTGAEAIAAVREHKPDVLLLDIRLPGMDGFAVVDALDRQAPPYVVFVTAFDRYAVDAFSVRALDYVLKPVQPARLAEALQRAREKLRTRNDKSHWTELMVRVGTRDVLVRVNEIDWIEADTYCAQLHVGPRTFVHRERMHVLETHLDPSVFVRVHRSAIVNLDRVREIVHEGGEHVIVLSTGARVRASHTRWLEFRDAMRQRASTG